MRHRCGFIPPHILRHLAEHTDDDALRDRVEATLEESTQVRGERLVLATLASVIGVPAGEKRRTVYDARNTRALPGKLVRGEGDGPTRDCRRQRGLRRSRQDLRFLSEGLSPQFCR